MPRKKQTEYKLEVLRNGTVKASLKVYEKELGNLRYEDKEDLQTAAGRETVVRRTSDRRSRRRKRQNGPTSAELPVRIH